MALRKAGEDPAIQGLGYAALLANAAPGVVSGIDVFTGESNGLNSGEIPLNMLIGLIPGVAALGTTGLGYALSPDMRATLDLIFAEQDRKALQREAKRLSEQEKKTGKPTDPATLQAMAARIKEMQDEGGASIESMKNRAALYQERDAALSADDAMRMVGRKGLRGLYGAALAGGVAGGIPAILMMQDRPGAVQEPAA